MPDRVVLDGQRAVPARVRHLEPIALEDLLAHLDVVGQPLAVLQGAVAAFVQGHLGVDQRAMLLEEPGHAIMPAPFFVGSQRHDQVAIGHEAFLAVTDQVGDERRGHRLVVRRAATVEVAVSLEGLNGSTDQSSRLASTTSRWASSKSGRRAPVPRRRATTLPLRGAGTSTWTSAAGKPAAISRRAIASAAFVLSPIELVVLISISSW